MKKIYTSLLLSVLFMSTSVMAQNRPFESINGSISVSDNINNQAPNITLPPGVKMYGADYGRVNENINEDINIIQPGIEKSLVDDELSLEEEINTIRGGVGVTNPMLPNEINPISINQGVSIQNRQSLNLNQPKKTGGQVSIEPVIIPSTMSDFNRTTIKEFTEIGNKKLEESYREFLMK